MATSSESSEKTWIGTSMEDIYRGHGPWGFEIPPVTASRHHAILYELPATLDNPPKPHISLQDHHWDDDHVRMPYSPKNLFPFQNEDGEKVLRKRWELMQESLLQPIKSSKELEAVINSYNSRLPKFLALHNFFENVLDEEETKQFFDILLPKIIELALRLPEILPGNIPLLKQGSCKSVSFSQLQISSLLANAFLCTFPWRKDSAASYPGINFARLFAAHLRPKREQAVAEKLKCICHYFRRVIAQKPVGVVTFERKHFPKSHIPRWDRSENNLGNTRIHVSSTGVIEDEGSGLLQVDFANKNVGGGILGFGCVQEEIRFIICPELIISRLFTEQLGPTEALIITGAERYSNYTGYGDLFEWSGNCCDKTPHDSSGRRRTSIAAIDAVRFSKPLEQYNPSNMLRELNKAYVGFHSRFEGQLPAVATGNWGCGAFRGDPNLKSLIQLMACSAARRDMVYFTFGDSQLCNNIYEIHTFLATNQVTISQLWRYLCQFANAKVKSEHLFSYVQQAHFDSKRQLCIKDFFCFNKKKMMEKSSPSTSSHSPNKDVDVVDGINSNSEDLEIIDASPIESNKEIDSDVDIIESSQKEQQEKRQLFKVSRRSIDKNVNYQGEDILRLFDEIDGEFKKSEDNTTAKGSLLSAIDEYSKRTKDKDVIINMPEETEIEQMDIDEIESEPSSKSSSSNETSKMNEFTSKRKITDYFVKIDKG